MMPSRLPRLLPTLFATLALAAFAITPSTQLEAADPDADTLNIVAGPLRVHPLNHATLALQWNGLTVYVDPVGGAERFAGLPAPDLILITDTHGDHLQAATLKAVMADKTTLITSAAAAAQLPGPWSRPILTLTNGQSQTVQGIQIEAIPAYNLSPDRLQFHPKGRGNGYLLELGGKRVYLSGDTEDIPEMRALKHIDLAFVCMNLPYTMTVEQAADAVRAFRPAVVYPYHCRGSDLAQFNQRVGTDLGIEVRIRNWYPTP